MARTDLTHERLVAALTYDKDSGEFRWLEAKGKNKIDCLAGTIHSLGYRIIGLDKHLYRSCRLAWFYVNKTWPIGVIDHINRNKLDDRFDNLRDVSHRINCINRGLQSNNTSGITGVRFEKQSGKWFAYIKEHKQMKAIGRYVTKEQAMAARRAAELQLGYGSPSPVEL